MPRARARRRRGGGRARRGQPADHAGRRRRRAASPTAAPRTAAAARTPTPTPHGVVAVVDGAPQVTLDDGADLLTVLHAARPAAARRPVGGTEETTTGLVRLRALQAEGRLACPVIAVNEARTERLFNDHFGTGQSTLDGILRATNLLLAGKTHRRARLRVHRQGRRAARPRRRRAGHRLRGRPDARARGAHGGLRGHARASRPPSAATCS